MIMHMDRICSFLSAISFSALSSFCWCCWRSENGPGKASSTSFYCSLAPVLYLKVIWFSHDILYLITRHFGDSVGIRCRLYQPCWLVSCLQCSRLHFRERWYALFCGCDFISHCRPNLSPIVLLWPLWRSHFPLQNFIIFHLHRDFHLQSSGCHIPSDQFDESQCCGMLFVSRLHLIRRTCFTTRQMIYWKWCAFLSCRFKLNSISIQHRISII